VLFNTDKERIVIEIGSGWTKVLVGSSLGKKKKKGLFNENISVKDTFLFKTPLADILETDILRDSEQPYTPIFNEYELIEKIREKFFEKRIKANEVIITLSDRSVVSREMILPKVEEDKLKDIIRYELQELLPIDQKKYVIDFKVIEEVKVSGVDKYKLIVSALPKDEGKYYHGFIDELGKDPYALDIASNSISKLFDRNMKINSKDRDVLNLTYAYVDIGYSNIKLHIIEKGILKFTRNIEGGVKSIMAVDGVKIIESEESIELVKKWIGSLEQMFKFFTSRETNRQIDHIFLFGGGALIPNVEEYFSKIIGVSTETIEQIENLDFHKDCSYFSLPLFLNTVASLIRR